MMTILRRIRHLMVRNEYLRKWIVPINESKIMKKRSKRKYERELTEKALEFKACYEAHKAEFESVAQMLEDDFSRKTLQTVIDYRLNPRGGGY